MDFVAFDPLSTAEAFTAGAGIFGGKVIKISADRNYENGRSCLSMISLEGFICYVPRCMVILRHMLGEEVFISYGLKSSAECLEDHGIVPDLGS